MALPIYVVSAWAPGFKYPKAHPHNIYVFLLLPQIKGMLLSSYVTYLGNCAFVNILQYFVTVSHHNLKELFCK